MSVPETVMVFASLMVSYLTGRSTFAAAELRERAAQFGLKDDRYRDARGDQQAVEYRKNRP